MIRYLQFFSAFASVRRSLFTFAAGALFLPGGGAAVQEPRRSFQIVVAATRERGGIGKNGQLPWKLSKDINFFKNVTSTTTSPSKKNAVVMGRCTSEVIPEKLRPMRGRFNLVQSSSRRAKNSIFDNNLFDAALALLAAPPLSSEIKFVFVIGGGQVYRVAMSSPLCDAIHLTEIKSSFDCDTFMAAVDVNLFQVWSSSFPVV
ncbi:unnamed protein product [Sphagnum balticum]